MLKQKYRPFFDRTPCEQTLESLNVGRDMIIHGGTLSPTLLKCGLTVFNVSRLSGDLENRLTLRESSNRKTSDF